jgi:hypothetical protein
LSWIDENGRQKWKEVEGRQKWNEFWVVEDIQKGDERFLNQREFGVLVGRKKD